MYIQSYSNRNKQYGFGSWLKKNANWLAPVGAIGATILTGGLAAPAAGAALAGGVGAGAAAAGTAAAAGGLGASLGTLGTAAGIGSAVGNPISQNEKMNEAQGQQVQQQQQMQDNQLAQNRLGQLDQQKQYQSTFGYGGKMKANGGIIESYPKKGRVHYNIDGTVNENPSSQQFEPSVPTNRPNNFRSQQAALGYQQSIGSGSPIIYDPSNPSNQNVSGLNEQGSLITRPATDQSFMNSPAYQQSFQQGQYQQQIPPVPPTAATGIKANGGQLEPTIYKNGGSHESNPLGGVPLGNTGNSVEEGEVRFGEYIFSARF